MGESGRRGGKDREEEGKRKERGRKWFIEMEMLVLQYCIDRQGVSNMHLDDKYYLCSDEVM